jgi:hypothetical protein
MRRTSTEVVSERANKARGGISLLSTFTGVLVALGTLLLLSALVAGVIEAIDDLDTSSGTVEIGIGAGITFIVAQFIAYLWGGYTAGRMGRGAGVAHGILVPLFALVLAAIVAGIATALGAAANVGMPFTETRLPVERDYLIDWGVGIGIGSLVAMFLGGIIGGLRGAAWHTKLETEKEAEIHETIESRSVETVPPDREPDESPEETTSVYSTPSGTAGTQETTTQVPPTVVPPPADPAPERSSEAPPPP